MRTSLLFRWCCISSALAAIVAAASYAGGNQDPRPATVYGHVEFRGFVRAPSYRDDFYSYRAPGQTTREPDPLRAIVYLEGDNLEPASQPPTAVIDQKGESFVPHILAVQRGARVSFRNSDDIYHNVFSFSKIRRFDLGRYPKGQSRSVVFDRVGLVRVFCEIHSHMSAFVLVLPHSYFTTTDASGSYRIPNVPAGSYHVVAWSDPFRLVRKEVRLRSGESSELDFLLEQTR